jgi:hypothetical protein
MYLATPNDTLVVVNMVLHGFILHTHHNGTFRAKKISISIGSSTFAYSGKNQHRRSKKQPF